ncbi:hypothetical protein PGT21_015766 [Puccinia graminis f. sp. tritici]|uniref:Uncharacterized protein n=1 Tax=Puccinia graminis f. sp. tritici TaxID=56615 RepID=A0A5B0MKI6_PUCGR|nr:hypothetical protein PGTUg99_006975 [Puccinia graminis f. sp. tritici]KAA1092839.1 hypothetical protein PGT21_015766 [Puccinia graminis f. sp. tritici]KAA1133809.1 hypothetical protein PGTUg99_021112 [Puccinia graminis f. sp. tritici]
MNQLPITVTPTITLEERRRRRIGWDRDGIAGGPSSIQLLLLWITAGANYTQWTGSPFRGQEREDACTEIQQFMLTQGSIHRDPRDINRKIQQLRLSYKSARDFVVYTTGGDQPDDPIIQAYIRRLCPYWDLLHPVMAPVEYPPVGDVEVEAAADELEASDEEPTNSS